jgi:hypothetical protein
MYMATECVGISNQRRYCCQLIFSSNDFSSFCLGYSCSIIDQLANIHLYRYILLVRQAPVWLAFVHIYKSNEEREKKKITYKRRQHQTRLSLVLIFHALLAVSYVGSTIVNIHTCRIRNRREEKKKEI